MKVVKIKVTKTEVNETAKIIALLLIVNIFLRNEKAKDEMTFLDFSICGVVINICNWQHRSFRQ